jgi:predicted RNase H-like nuclease (RuvC/YqgF family)
VNASLSEEQTKSASHARDAADTRSKLQAAHEEHTNTIRTLKSQEDALREEITNFQRELESKSQGASAETTELRSQLAKLKIELETKMSHLNTLTTQLNETKVPALLPFTSLVCSILVSIDVTCRFVSFHRNHWIKATANMMKPKHH